MKVHPDCIPCLLKRIIFESEQSTTDKVLRIQVVRNVCKNISEQYTSSISSANLATKAHKVAYETLHDNDPYLQLKKESNAIAQTLVPVVEHLIQKSSTPLKTSMICSIIGNILDFGIEGGSKDPKALVKNFSQFYDEGLGHDDYPAVEHLIQSAHRIMVFTDNCGEVVFDKLLCRELKRFRPSLHISLVVKGEPIISDATLEDIKNLGFEQVVDAIYTTGCYAIGVDFSKLPVDVTKALEQADVIICKGMANYEAFSETSFHPVVYLLRTKCQPIAESMGLLLYKNIIKLYK